MTRLNISEFMFGFAFLHEQANIHSTDLTAAPILPSLIQEQDKGWDAHLPVRGSPYFYQFKLSDYLTRANARFIKNGVYSSPYYCFRLHKDNNNMQHNKLRLLCAHYPNTFYVAPELHNEKDFNTAYLHANLSAQTRLIPLTGCSDIHDNEQHYITYQKDSVAWIEHSEMKKREISYRGNEIDKLYDEQRNKHETINLDFALALYKNLVSLINHEYGFKNLTLSNYEEQFLHLSHSNKSLKTILQHTARVAKYFYGVTLVLVGKKREY